MGEQVIRPESLTSQPHPAYARGGDISMPIDNTGDTRRPPRPRTQEEVIAAMPRREGYEVAEEMERAERERGERVAREASRAGPQQRPRLAENMRPISGGANGVHIQADDIQDPRIRRELERLNNFMDVNDGVHDTTLLQEADKHIGRLEGVNPADRSNALNRIRAEQVAARQHMEQEALRHKPQRNRREEESDDLDFHPTDFYGATKLSKNEIENIPKWIEQMIKTVRDRSEAHGGDHGLHAVSGDLEHNDLDQLFNRMFRRVDNSPRESFEHAFGQVGSQEETEFFTQIQQYRFQLQKEHKHEESGVVEQIIHKYEVEKSARSTLHNAYYIADSGREMKDFVGFIATFASEYADAAFQNAPEVEAAVRVREQVLFQIKRENNGFIPHSVIAFNPKIYGSEFDHRAKAMMRTMNGKKLFGDILGEWKIDRALELSRGLGMVTWRYLEIVAECPLPDINGSNKAQQSIPWELITWDMNPMDHKVKRYRIGRQMQSILIAGGTRTKQGMWDKNELSGALEQYEISKNIDESSGFVSGMDRNNLFKIGGPFTHTGWRTFVAAMDENMEGLEPMLENDPGVAIKLLFNRYHDHDQVKERDAFLKSPGVAGLSTAETKRLWDEEKERTKDAANERWSDDDANAFKSTTARIPHVMLRLITDPGYKLLDPEERTKLMRDIFGDRVNQPGFQEYYSNVETQLTIAKEGLLKRRREYIAEKERREKAHESLEGLVFKNRLVDDPDDPDDDFKLITDDGLRDQAITLHRVMTDRMDNDDTLVEKIIEKHKARGFMFAITAEDIPWGEFAYRKTGGRGFFTRKANDNMADKGATDELMNILKNIKQFKKPEQIYESIYKMFMAAETHDLDRAQDAVIFVLKGIIRVYQKDGILKIPILGDLESARRQATGQYEGDSLAQDFYGRSIAPAWDDDAIYNLISMFQPILEKDQIEALRKEVGATLGKALWAKSKLAIYLGLITFMLEFFNKLTKTK